MELIAHRGMPRAARENTLASFELALQARADGIELDVHVSADAVVVVHHDALLPGKDATPLVDLTAEDLRRRGIPSLDADCDRVGERATLYVEAKAPHSAAQIVECLTAHQVRAAVHSVDPEVVYAVRSLAPGLPVGLLLPNAVTDPAAIARSYAVRDLWPAHELIDAHLVATVHGLGARVIAWTVNDPNDARRLRQLGVDGLCTDDVAALREALTR
jgi:glycerophosphoryl diester phosphodiesterase